MQSGLGCVIEPFPESESLETERELVQCLDCDAYLNQFCKKEENSSRWVCNLCQKSNDYVKKVFQAESGLQSQVGTVLIVDTITDETNFAALMNGLDVNLKRLNSSFYILISILKSGTVKIHSPNYKDVVFDISKQKVAKSLELFNEKYFTERIGSIVIPNIKTLHSALESLRSDDTASRKRCKRATGLALFLASVVAKNFQNSHIVSFLSGPCTKGPGKVLGRDIKEVMRGINSFTTNKLKWCFSATQFYQRLGNRYNGITTYDFFISSLDQVGIVEKSGLLSKIVLQFDSFQDERFQESLSRYITMRNDSAIYNVEILAHFTSGLKSKDTKWRYQCVLKPKDLGIPIAFTSKFNNETQAVQLQIKYAKNRRNCFKIYTTLVSMDFRNQYSFLLKQLSWQVLSAIQQYFKHSQQVIKAIDILCSSYINEVNETMIGPLCYQLRRSMLALWRNTSPDELVMFANNIFHSETDTCLKAINPVIYQYSNSKLTKVASTEFSNSSLPMLIDGGFLFVALRYIQDHDLDDIKSTPLVARLLYSKNDLPMPLYIETKPLKSQDRYLKSRIIPLDSQVGHRLDSEDVPYNVYINNIKS